MSAFTRLPVPPLPERALGSTDALYTWAQPLMMRTYTKPFWANVYFFLSFKVALMMCCSMFMGRLIRRGEFWLFRFVRVRRGTILVPKATNTPLFFGACFILVDTVYRIKVIQWFRGPTYEPFRNYMLLEGLRLSPAWLSSWFYLCGSSLVWPLQAEKLRPLYWHLGLIGVPILFYATFTPFMVESDRWLEQAQAIYLVLERELLAAPGTALTQSMKDQALLFHDLTAEAAYYTGVWAIIGACWLLLVILGEITIGSTLLRRVYKAYTQIPAYTAAHHTWSVLDASVANANPPLKQGEPTSQDQKPKVSRLRMAKYFAGVAPLASTANERLGPLPPATVRRILRSFFFHTLAEFGSLCVSQVAIFCVAVYLAAHAYIDTREAAYDAVFGNKLGRTNATYHLIELWAVVTFGSAFVISVLKRQVFRLHIPPHESNIQLHTLQAPAGEHGASSSVYEQTAASMLSPIQPAGSLDWPTELYGELKTPSRSLRSAASTSALTSSDCHVFPSAMEGFRTTTLVPLPPNTSEEDISWYAGRNMGRSIVMNALARGDNIGTKAAWRTNYLNKEVDQHGSTPQKFATEHGVVDLSPHNHLPTPASSPRSPQSSKWFSFHSSSPSSL